MQKQKRYKSLKQVSKSHNIHPFSQVPSGKPDSIPLKPAVGTQHYMDLILIDQVWILSLPPGTGERPRRSLVPLAGEGSLPPPVSGERPASRKDPHMNLFE